MYCREAPHIVPIVYPAALAAAMPTMQAAFERYGMMVQLQMYGEKNFGNETINGNHSVGVWKHGGDEKDTYTCIYLVEFHSQQKMVKW